MLHSITQKMLIKTNGDYKYVVFRMNFCGIIQYLRLGHRRIFSFGFVWSYPVDDSNDFCLIRGCQRMRSMTWFL